MEAYCQQSGHKESAWDSGKTRHNMAEAGHIAEHGSVGKQFPDKSRQ